MSMPDEMRRYIEDLQRHIQHRDQEIQRLQWQLQQLAEQLKVAQASGGGGGAPPDGQTSRQLNDLKRENRDLRIKLLDLENSQGGGDPSALIALQQQNRDLEAALQRAQQQIQQQTRSGGASPQDSAELDALRRENASLKQQISRGGAAASSTGAAPAPRAAFDQVISALEQSLGQLRRERERAPADAGPSPSDHDDMLADQIRELERTNRQLERDLERALSSSGGAGGGSSGGANDAELQALRQKFAQAERHIHDLTQANQALEAQANSGGGGGGDAARQLNTLKRENRDLRMALDEARAGGGGGEDTAPLQARIHELEMMLRQRAQGGAGGGDPRLRETISTFSTSAEEILGQWRGELRALSDQNQELRKLSDLIIELPGSARSNLDEVDVGLIADTLDEFVENAQKSIQKLKDQLRPLRDAAS